MTAIALTPERHGHPSFLGTGFALNAQARRTVRPNRVHLRCGLDVHFRLLPTPPRGDAVTISYRPVSADLKRTHTSRAIHTCRRTHIRYGGRGIMIYWHVERKSLCIHSQLKSPSSSEVASMIEGVVHHCTEMEIDRQYVDSHGQSTVAFAFCRLLGFQLLPRLKAIHSQKLSRADVGHPDAYKHLQAVLTKPIDWGLIRQQYHQMVKYATAVRLGTAETEAILRRFTRNNVQHPTYKAFAELGKAVKTVFLCRYLHDEGLRREIHEGLNVIEQWNGANDLCSSPAAANWRATAAKTTRSACWRCICSRIS